MGTASPIVNIGKLIGMRSERERTPFGRRMYEARRHAGLTQVQVREHLGISQSNLSDIENIAEASGFTVQLAVLYQCDAHWLATGEGEPNYGAAPSARRRAIPIDENPDYPAIRRVRFKLSAGATGFEVDYMSNGDSAPIVFRKDWYSARGLKPEALFAIKVSGASMEQGLYEGDTVVVNTADTTPRDGEVFAINYEGELVVKRLVRESGDWWLTSDNHDQRRFPRKVCDEACTILGRVVHKQSEHI